MKSGRSLTVALLSSVFLLRHPSPCWSQTYNDTKTIFDNKLASNVYNTEIPPLNDQSQRMTVGVAFEVLSIVRVDDVSQSFLCNGFLGLSWVDQRLAWNPNEYGGVQAINPQAKAVWRPRIILMNTFGARDLFEDDHAPLGVDYTGGVLWAPGSLFPATCKLDLTNYPFDEQTCTIWMFSMSLREDKILFEPGGSTVGLTFFTSNGEWKLTRTQVSTEVAVVQGQNVPYILITFNMKRLPTFLLLNILMPVVLLSFLNILVFTIPVESGEKISYGITVLLALSVFMSIVSGLLPRSSDNVPLVTIYLFTLLIVSTLTVVMSIIIVLLHHMEEKEKQHIKVKETFSNIRRKIGLMRQAVSPVTSNNQGNKLPKRMPSSLSFTDSLPAISESKPPETKEDEETTELQANRYKLNGEHINKVSFVVFFVVWASLTMGFLIRIAA